MPSHCTSVLSHSIRRQGRRCTHLKRLRWRISKTSMQVSQPRTDHEKFLNILLQATSCLDWLHNTIYGEACSWTTSGNSVQCPCCVCCWIDSYIMCSRSSIIKLCSLFEWWWYCSWYYIDQFDHNHICYCYSPFDTTSHWLCCSCGCSCNGLFYPPGEFSCMTICIKVYHLVAKFAILPIITIEHHWYAMFVCSWPWERAFVTCAAVLCLILSVLIFPDTLLVQVVIAPIMLGLALNTYAKGFVNKVRQFMPLVAMVCTSLCIGSPLALNRSQIVSIEGFKLLFPVLAFHMSAFILGYWVPRITWWRSVFRSNSLLLTGLTI